MTPQDRRNIVLNAVGEGLWGFQTGLVTSATVLPVLLQDYGAAAWMIGSISAIEGGGILLPQVFGLYLFSDLRRRKVRLVLWHLAFIIPFLFLIGLLVRHGRELPAPAVQYGLLGLFLLMSLLAGVIVGVWTDWMAHLFATQIRGLALGLAWGGASGAGTLGALLSGWMLKRHPGEETYFRLYTLAGAAAVVSILVFLAMRDPAEAVAAAAPRPATSEILARFRLSMRDRNFRAFLISRLLSTAGFCILPFVAVFYTAAEGGALKKGTVVSLSAGMKVSAALGALLLGRLGDRRGHRLGMLAAAAVQVLALALLLATRGQASCLAVYICAGFLASAGFVSNTNLLFETCPHDHRIVHITAGNLVMGAGTILAPVLAGLAASAWGLRVLFAMSLGLSVAALVWSAIFVKEPRRLLLMRQNEP